MALQLRRPDDLRNAKMFKPQQSDVNKSLYILLGEQLSINSTLSCNIFSNNKSGSTQTRPFKSPIQ